MSTLSDAVDNRGEGKMRYGSDHIAFSFGEHDNGSSTLPGFMMSVAKREKAQLEILRKISDLTGGKKEVSIYAGKVDPNMPIGAPIREVTGKPLISWINEPEWYDWKCLKDDGLIDTLTVSGMPEENKINVWLTAAGVRYLSAAGKQQKQFWINIGLAIWAVAVNAITWIVMLVAG